ncbi:hypothetical protein [Lacticaseibacillus porcinae]|uniref:hypothetical protein n=1 Tax=Lacticaseibacillus porcinae TaxID=1123687 RepID=UPI000F7B8202|nr:hypothetical protein [Lacticaseibacillus porcinae]
MSISELIPYAPAILGVLALILYAFMRREAAKALPIPEGTPKAGLDLRLKAYLRLAEVEPKLAVATHRYWTVTALTVLAYVATFGAWLPEVTNWSGLFATWWWLLIALCLHLASVWLHHQVLTLEAHAVGALADDHQAELHDLHLFGDGRWYAQLQSTQKYLIAALALFFIAVICCMILW